ncbi:GNAT family N-acetyltransferase [Tateyamaria omphalii]|uniref:GNAT family N-acetyltransferase n=1 Tax=Tateyamaria omphalii TaxID=299262 RepID=UPI001C994B8C|nr:GNAT family N-acetyltransferase [Tateyamaria omphalii]MBY5931808.1 GNAT family N-acetyltransferase [Tateyamaria omphalii]
MTYLRPAKPTDAGAVGAILSGFIDGTTWMPRIHTRAEDLSFAGHMIERGWVTVAEQGGQIRAFSARNGADVHALYVDARAQGQGIGADLLAEMQAASDHLTLWTFETNTGAQRFYLRHGFVEVERTDGARNDEGLPDIRYDWHKEGA